MDTAGGGARAAGGRRAAPRLTGLLGDWSGGDRAAFDALVPLVEQELRTIARRCLGRERGHHTLQPTALVNEAYLRLVDQEKVEWQCRAQFFGLAARLMRNILIDHARVHQAAKRGRRQLSISVSKVNRIASRCEVDLVALHEALERLAANDLRKSQIVEFRFFGGLTIDETAAILNLSHATVERDWNMARAWLRRELET
jgi:RNA polymerase sigma-70 factor, ECF subfamily